MISDIAPIIITLRMDDAASGHFTALRTEHFPAERNFLGAHITLFHKLPGQHVDTILHDVAHVAEHTSRYALHTDGLLFFGAGVAYRLASSETVLLRQQLAGRWRDWLAPQDQKNDFTPHITIQNKVKADIAKDLFQTLNASFEPYRMSAIGLDVWHYRGGPWEQAGGFAFGD